MRVRKALLVCESEAGGRRGGAEESREVVVSRRWLRQDRRKRGTDAFRQTRRREGILRQAQRRKEKD